MAHTFSKKLIVVCGATASGKTDLAVQIAKKHETEVLSADSRQFFKEMSIGTAKPTAEEMSGIVHHFVDNKHIWEDYNAGQYEEDAHKILADIFKKNDYAIMVGGSGLYIRAVCEGFDELPEVSAELRETIAQEFKENGLAPLLAELKAKDFTYFEQVDRQNPVRVMRALEIIRTANMPYSTLRGKPKAQRDFAIEYLMPEWSRAQLYARIDARVDIMMQKGLLEEVEKLLPYKTQNAMQTVGYRELIDFFEGKTTLDFAVDKIKQNSRNYAKRQLTWFRKIPDLTCLPMV